MPDEIAASLQNLLSPISATSSEILALTASLQLSQQTSLIGKEESFVSHLQLFEYALLQIIL